MQGFSVTPKEGGGESQDPQERPKVENSDERERRKGTNLKRMLDL